jgi:hypothetical protein
MVVFNEQIPLPEAPKREGFDFQWLDVPNRMPANNLTIYGQYSPQRMTTEIINGIAYNIYLQEGWAEVTALPEGLYVDEITIAPSVSYAAASFTVKGIADYAFRNSKQMTKVTIPETIESIGVQAFRDCWALTSITLPASITKLEKEAFMYCTTLKTVECEALTLPTTGEDVFKNIPIADAELIVHVDCIGAYRSQDPWKNFGTIRSFEGTDDIELIYTDLFSTNAPIYDLNGRLVMPAGSTIRLPKGIYIQNGKKIAITK